MARTHQKHILTAPISILRLTGKPTSRERGLTRIFQFKVLDNEFSTSEICRFYREFKVVKISSSRYINITRSSDFVVALAERLHQPVTHYHLTESQIKMMHTR